MVSLQEETATSAELQPNRQGPWTLVPVLPSSNNRYNQPVYRTANNNAAIQKVQLIPPCTRVASFSGSPSPVAGWECYVHPEGDKYYRHARLKTVTPVSPHNLVAGRILEQAATALIDALGPIQGDNTIEIYLNMPEDGKNDVQYCYIDHTNGQVFWARATSTVELGFESDGFLKSALTGEYWNHVENFPCHQIYRADVEDELRGILGHGAIDDMTSFGSTFPYSAQECREHLQILEGFAGSDKSSGYRTATFARLWASVTRARHINGYGLPSPRLDRNAEFKKGRPNFFSGFKRITELWNGRVVFQRHWHTYFAGYTRRTKPEKNRMAELGFPWNLLHRNQPEPLQGHSQSINHQHQNGSPVALVAMRRQHQPDWTPFIQTLIDPLAISVAYSILLIGVEGYLEPERALNALFFLASLATLTATILLLVFYPGLHVPTAGHVLFNDRAGAVFGRNWILTSFLAFDALAYGWLLHAFCRCLDTPEHQFSTPGLLFVTTALALPPAFHVIKLNNEIEKDKHSETP